MRDLNREIGRTCDEISSSRERLAEMSVEADPTTPTLIRCASEATSDAPPDAELKVYANYRPAVIERTQQQLQRQSQVFRPVLEQLETGLRRDCTSKGTVSVFQSWGTR